MTQYLTKEELNALSDAIINTVGYSPAKRRIYLSDINQRFKSRLSVDNNEQTQLDLDLLDLNKTERLVDGTIPFQSWLQTAARDLKPYPAEIAVVQTAQATVEGKSTKSLSVTNISSPTAETTRVMERIVQQNDMLTFAFLEAGWKAGLGVVRLLVQQFENGIPKVTPGGAAALYAGTGWLLTNELVMTNHHVINARTENEPDASSSDFSLQAAHAVAEFDYNIDETEGLRVKVTALEASNPELDYAILRLKTPIDRRPPARFPNEIQITNDNPQPVNIIQHPFGHSKKVAIRNNHIFESNFPFIGYFTDTEKGSSGSPVFNDKWQVVALHRASRLVKDVTYQGKSTGWVNEGVQLKAIFDHMDAHFKNLRVEILNN